jgi:hypothetical protein
LLDLYHDTAAVERVLVETESAKGETRKKLWPLLVAIVLAADLYKLPHDISEASKTYKGWFLSPLLSDPALPKPDVPLLPAPAAVEPRVDRPKPQDDSEDEKLPNTPDRVTGGES